MPKKTIVTNLTNQAKNGNIEAYNHLIENNDHIIKKYALSTYEEIKTKYQLYYNLETNSIFPNSIIDIDDVIQDFYIKSLEYLNMYINSNRNIYFSSFLGNYLMKYQPLYVNKTLKKIIKKYDNEIYETLDTSFTDYLEKKINKKGLIKF